MNKLSNPRKKTSARQDLSSDSGHEHGPLFDAEALLIFLKKITRRLNAGTGIEDSLKTALEEIATFVGWPVGHVYLLDETVSKLRPTDIWYGEEQTQYESFIEFTRTTDFTLGQGMPGRVWESAVPQWMAGVDPGPEYPRAHIAYQTGLVSGFGFPLTSDGAVVGVAEFFSINDQELDAEFLDCLDVIGSRLGRIISYAASQDMLERSARILDHVDEIIAITDSNGVIKDCNTSFSSTFGISKAEVIGKRTGDFAAPGGNIEAIRKAAFPTLEATGAWQGEIAFQVSDGTTRVFELNTVRHQDPVTKDIGLIISGRDITRRKEAEESLRTNENRLARAIETHDAAVFDRDFESDSTFMSESMKAISGYGEDLGDDRRKWLDLVLPQDKAISKDAFGALRRGDKDRFDIEYRIRNAEGEIRWIRSRGMAVKTQSGKTVRAIGMLQDITQSKTALDQLRLSNAALEATDSAVAIADATSEDHNIVYVNPAFERMMGYASAEVIGKRPTEIFKVQNEDENIQALLAAERNGTSVDLTMQTESKDGTPFTRQVIVSPIRDKSGTVTHLVSVSKDITHVKMREDLLRRQATVVETMADAVVISDEQGTILDYNPAYARMMACDLSQLIGKFGHDYQVDSPDRPNPADRIRATVSDGKTWQGELDVRRCDGKIIVVEAHITAMPDNTDGSKTIIAVCRDVTTRKQMEASLDRQTAALNNIKEAMLIQNADGTVVECNEGAVSLYGYAADELIGMNSRNLIPNKEKADALFARAVPEITANGYWSGETDIKQKDGSIRQIEISSTLLRDRSGAIRGWVELNRDITDRKELEKELRLSRAALEAADVSVVITDAQKDDRPIIYANPAFEKMTGYSREESLGKPHTNFIDIDTDLQSLAQWEKKGPNLQPVQFTAPTTRKDGRTIMREVRVAPIYDDSDILTNWLSLSHDATDELRVQENLRRQAIIMATMSDAVAITDTSGTILDCNAAYERLAGYDREELIGQSTLSTWIDAQEDAAIVEEIASRTMSGKEWSGENRLRHKDGAEIVVETNVTPIVPETGDITSAIIVCRDVTERKQIENARHLHSLVMEQLDEAVLIVDLDGVVIECNAKTEVILGYSREKLVGQLAVSLLGTENEDDQKAWRQHMLQKLKENGTVQVENVVRRLDGELRDVFITFGSLTNESGEEFARVVVAKDITEEKRILNVQRLHSMVMEQLDEAVVVLNLDSEVIDCNAKAERMMGYSREELIGQMPINMMAGATEAERAAFRQDVLKELEEKALVQFESKLQRKDGAVRDVHVTYGDLVNESHETFARVVVAKDITDEKQAAQDLEVSRQRVEAVIEASRAGIWEMDIVKGRTFIGPVLKDLSGYGESFTDDIKQWRNLVHPDDVEIYDSRYKDWDGKRQMVDAEYRILNKDGEIRWVRSRGEMFGNQAGEMVRGIGLGWDITEEKEQEQRQEDLEQRLMQSQKMETLGTLTGGIAHDFNNILTPILGYAHLARADINTGNDVQPHLDRVISGAERAKELVRRILTFSRQIEPSQVLVDIQAIAREVFSLITASAPPQVDIQVTSDGGNAQAMADGVQMHQALMNLCTNGLQAMGEGPGLLTIEVNVVPVDSALCLHKGLNLPAGQYICLAVQDTGPGIDSEIADRIFEPFFTTKDVDEGTGLGLSVVHGIVESHHGAIILDKDVEQGTRFAVYLPLFEEESDPTSAITD